MNKPFDYPEHNSWDSKSFCLDAMSQNTFITRPNIYWEWYASSYEKGIFGSRVGPAHSFFDSGLHDLAHCIDFMMQGRPSRLMFGELHFRRPYVKHHYMLGQSWTDVDPKTARVSCCEIRVWAIQLFLMKKSFGTFYVAADKPFNAPDRVKAVTLEEAAHDNASAAQFLDDYPIFVGGYGQNKEGSLKLYTDAILKMYRGFNTPFGERRIKNALDRVNTRLAHLHMMNLPTSKYVW